MLLFLRNVHTLQECPHPFSSLHHPSLALYLMFSYYFPIQCTCTFGTRSTIYMYNVSCILYNIAFLSEAIHRDRAIHVHVVIPPPPVIQSHSCHLNYCHVTQMALVPKGRVARSLIIAGADNRATSKWRGDNVEVSLCLELLANMECAVYTCTL